MLIGRRRVRLISNRIVGAVIRVDWRVFVDFLIVWWAPCLVAISVQPWSTVARRSVPKVSGGFMICWVESGVRNHREVVIV